MYSVRSKYRQMKKTMFIGKMRADRQNVQCRDVMWIVGVGGSGI
jgi:hypothetical protein